MDESDEETMIMTINSKMACEKRKGSYVSDRIEWVEAVLLKPICIAQVFSCNIIAKCLSFNLLLNIDL